MPIFGEVSINYKNIAGANILFSLVGANNDLKRSDKNPDKPSDLKRWALAYATSIAAQKDQSTWKGVAELIEILQTAGTQQDNEKFIDQVYRGIKLLSQKELKTLSAASPLNMNAVKQIENTFNPNTYTDEMVGDMWFINSMLYHVGATPFIADVAGEEGSPSEVMDLFGETQKLQAIDNSIAPISLLYRKATSEKRWEFLRDNGLKPPLIYNTKIVWESDEESVAKGYWKYMDDGQLQKYRTAAGKTFAAKIDLLMADDELMKKKDEGHWSGKTWKNNLSEAVAGAWTASKKAARDEMGIFERPAK